MDEQEEREHIHLAFEGIKALTGAAPVGWFNGRPSINTRRLVIEHGDFLYDRDYLGDELPFWMNVSVAASITPSTGAFGTLTIPLLVQFRDAV